MNRITDYIIALTHLYGLVHSSKVVEIYNMQNEEKIEDIDMRRLRADDICIDFGELDNNFVEVFTDYFVHSAIMENDDFYAQLTMRKNKPFYIPEQEELLKYKDDFYFEVNEEYNFLLSYFAKNFYNGNITKAEKLVEDIKMYCMDDNSINDIVHLISIKRISFKSEGQFNEMIDLVVKLKNNTRIWLNNGYTPNELFNINNKTYLKPLSNEVFDSRIVVNKEKTGRNDPCPCGSGKKYKKCCIDKE